MKTKIKVEYFSAGQVSSARFVQNALAVSLIVAG
nr:MAG TPA: hypothetical protein [Caudoviricetes sp.]